MGLERGSPACGWRDWPRSLAGPRLDAEFIEGYESGVESQKEIPAEGEDSQDNAVETRYDANFFARQAQNSLQSARIVVPIILSLLRPKSVEDIGVWGRFMARGVS